MWVITSSPGTCTFLRHPRECPTVPATLTRHCHHADGMQSGCREVVSGRLGVRARTSRSETKEKVIFQLKPKTSLAGVKTSGQV